LNLFVRSQEEQPLNPSPSMSFSRRLTAAIQDVPNNHIKHNQVLVEHVIYQRLLDISDGGIIVLRVTIDNPDAPADIQEKEFYVTVVGEHAARADVIVSQELINYFGLPLEGTRYRFTFTKKLPELTSVSIKFLENDFCFLDPREAVQAYLEDYHILYEGMLMQIPSQIDEMMGLVRIETLKPAIVCRVPNGEVVLEILEDPPAATPLRLPTVQPPSLPTPALIPTESEEPKPFNFHDMKRELFPDLGAEPPCDGFKLNASDASPLSREELRKARIAYYNKN
jgi:hypothetical protein